MSLLNLSYQSKFQHISPLSVNFADLGLQLSDKKKPHFLSDC